MIREQGVRVQNADPGWILAGLRTSMVGEGASS